MTVQSISIQLTSFQYQFCFGATVAKDTCTELGGKQNEVSNSTYPRANEIQLAIVSLLRNAADMYDIARPARYETQAVLSNFEGFVETLPDDQWNKEIHNWESIVWAAYQTLIADYSIGPTVRDPLAMSYVLPPANDAEKALCGMQKMRKPGGFV